MSAGRWSEILKRLGLSAENASDRIVNRLKRKLHKDTPLHIIAASHHEHKLMQIRKVLDAQPALNFLLIGDSGQDDPEI